MRRQVVAVILACTLAAMAAGCAGPNGPAPSSVEVSHAVTRLMATWDADAGASHATVISVTDLGCNLAPDGHGYLCGTVVKLAKPAAGTQKLTRLVRLVHTQSGWVATLQ